MSQDNEQHATPPDLNDDEPMFQSTMEPVNVNVSLTGDDEDDENPFGETTERKKTPTTTTNTVELSTNDEKQSSEPETKPVKLDENDENIFTTKNTNETTTKVTTQTSENVLEKPSQPVSPTKQDRQSFPTDLNTKSSESVRSQPSFEKQISSTRKQSKENHNVEITVCDPTKVGDGMSSYMTYRILTKTTLPIFKKPETVVNRRFSDFLGLHNKLISKHLHTGILLPSPPEKDSMSMAKVKISKDESIPTDFIDRRRALLERYLNRLAQHHVLIEDIDVREFLEMPHELPKSTNTQALSGAGVLRALSTISNQVTKLTTKTSEQDQWFEEKHILIVELHIHFKNLYNQLNQLFNNRKEAGQLLKLFSTTLNHLATIEEHPLLSSALVELANVEEKVDQVGHDQAMKEYSILTELVKEYVSLMEMVQLAFQERIKVHQQWLSAEDTLRKKRETKTKLEQTPKGADKLPQIEMEIKDWEGKVVQSKEDFERISTNIKQEMEVFEQTCFNDFTKAINNYLQNLLEEKEKILQIWEAYLPEANKINV